MYIGLKEVQSIADWLVSFIDGTCIKITPRQQQYIITDEPKGYTDYRNLVMDQIMPEVEAVLESPDENKDSTLEIANIFEEHDVSIAEVSKVIDLIIANRIGKYNELMKERMGEEIAKFEKDMERYKEVSQVLSDSHKRLICLAVGKFLGTYVDGEPFEEAWDNIRLSHIKPFI